MLNGDAMRFGSGPASGGDVSIATTKTYTTTIDFDEANLGTTGATLFDPPVGSTIEDIRIEVVTTFSGNSVFYEYVQVITDGSDPNLAYFTGGSGVSLDVATAPAGDKLRILGPTSYWGLAGAADFDDHVLPARVESACTLKVKAEVSSGGPATAGQMKVHVLVSEPDA